VSQIIAEAPIIHDGAFTKFLASLGAPRLGEYWEGQGGTLVNFQPAEGNLKDRLLLVSLDEWIDMEYGGYGKKIPGADSLIDGAANTLALIESKHDHPAAQKAIAYTKDGHSDFYLPAQREMNLIYATSPHLFTKAWYWSSSQFSASYAWSQLFVDGYQYAYDKVNRARVRAVRSLSI
jgi:hypothetical protein